MSVNVRFESKGKLEFASGTFDVHVEGFTFWFYPYNMLTRSDFLNPPDYYRPILLYAPCCGGRSFTPGVRDPQISQCATCNRSFENYGSSTMEASFDELLEYGSKWMASFPVNPLALDLIPHALKDILEPFALEVNTVYFTHMDKKDRGAKYLALAEKYSGPLI